MDFILKNGNSFIKFENVKFYDDSQDFEFSVNAKHNCFVIDNKTVWVNKNEWIIFCKKLQECLKNLQGEAETEFEYDEEIKLKLLFNNNGHVCIKCDIYEHGEYESICHIEFETDQTFINEALKGIEKVSDDIKI